VLGLGIIAKYKRGCFSRSLKIPFTATCTAHLLARVLGFMSQGTLPGIDYIFFELSHCVSICHLQDGEVYHVRIMVVLPASDSPEF